MIERNEADGRRIYIDLIALCHLTLLVANTILGPRTTRTYGGRVVAV